MGVHIPHGKGQFLGKGAPIVVVSCAKTGDTMDLPFGLWTWVGPRKHKLNRIRQVAPMSLMGGHIGATWRIRLNRPSAASMRCYVELL